MKNVLVIAAHPDDEILGCGGTIARLSKQGSTVNILILAEGITSRDKVRNRSKRQNQIENLRKQGKLASKDVGAKSITFLDYPDNRIDTVPLLNIVKDIEENILKFKPDTIFTHFDNDMNIDHTITNKATLTAARPKPGSKVKKIYAYEIMSSTYYNPSANFIPNFHVNIDKFIKIKLRALKRYKGEMEKFPHPRSLEAITALSKFRGSNIGFNNAESFKLLREIF